MNDERPPDARPWPIERAGLTGSPHVIRGRVKDPRSAVSHTQTLDSLALDGWDGAQQRAAAGVVRPRLRLVYHVDLSRIGALVELPTGQPTVVGRRAPLFSRAGQPPAPLEDPLVSREQLTVRWIASARQFEVAPKVSAKRPISRVHLAGATAHLEPLAGPVRVDPGTCLAIGDRVMLALEAVGTRPGGDQMDMVGDSAVIARLRDDIRAVARFDGPTLITGPTGAGKELVARAVHLQSPRASGPFVPVNCAALPERLVESILFGHRKGAFTGADANEPGLFLAAAGGTIFFDELGELPLQAQPKLLRVLQDGWVAPVGGRSGQTVDVRIIGATNRDLPAEVAAGTIRADLYHRVAGHLITVPALRARPFDVPRLFVHFLEGLRAQHPQLEWLWAGGARWRPTIPIRFFADLMCRAWDGNVRELRNYVERTARYCLQAGVFRAPDAPASQTTVETSTPPTPTSAPVDDTRVGEAANLLGLAHKTIARLLAPPVLEAHHRSATDEGWSAEQHRAVLHAAMSDALYDLLHQEGFNRTRAASQVNMSRTTFGKLLRIFGLRRAAELSPDELAAAAASPQGLIRMARELKVSVDGLQKQLTMYRLRQKAAGD